MRRASRTAGYVVAVAGLLVVVAVASRGRPHGSFASSRATVTLMAIFSLVAAALVVALAIDSRRPRSAARRAWSLGDVLVALALLLVVVLGAYGVGRLRSTTHRTKQPGVPCAQVTNADCAKSTTTVARKRPARAAARGHEPWLQVGVILILVATATGWSALAKRRRSRPPTTVPGPHATVGRALDLSIDDLRGETDPRRAIIAAYARMEAALGQAGLPRLPAEAPLEYLARSLTELDASAEAAHRLTDLFERAKFSQHEPTAAMRHDAVEALVAVRDELRAADR